LQNGEGVLQNGGVADVRVFRERMIDISDRRAERHAASSATEILEKQDILTPL
jgi:hypothetical protein